MTNKYWSKSAKSAAWLGWVMCFLGALFYGYEFYLRIAPSVMTDELMQHYKIGAGSLGNLSAFYYYAYAPMQIPVGILMDKYGPRRLLTIACASCVVGVFLFVGTENFWLAALGRFLVGFGSSFAFIGVLKLAMIWLPADRFALVSGLTVALGTAGAIIGDNSMAYMVHNIGWQQTMIYAAFVGIVLTFILWFVIRDAKSEVQARVAYSSMHIKAVILGWRRIMANPAIWLTGIAGCLLYLPNSAFAEMWGLPFLENVYHMSPQQAGFAISLVFFGFAAFAPVIGMISDRTQKRAEPLVISAIVAAAVMFALVYIPHLSKNTIYALLVLLGMSYSAHPLVFVIGREISPQRLGGTAVAVINCFVMMSGLIFQPLIGYLLDLTWDFHMMNGHRIYSAYSYKVAIMTIPVGIVIGAVLLYFVRNAKPQPMHLGAAH